MTCRKYHSSMWDCPNLTIGEVQSQFQRCYKHEVWAREKAAHWLAELKLAHGKIAMLKHELRKLRHNQKD